MAAPYSLDLRERVVEAVERGGMRGGSVSRYSVSVPIGSIAAG